MGYRPDKQIRVASSDKPDADSAIADIASQLDSADYAFLFVFSSPHFKASELEAAFRTYLVGVDIVGCSTAGEISGAGYQSDSIVAIGFPGAHFSKSEILFDLSKEFSLEAISSKAQQLSFETTEKSGRNLFGVLLCDGLSNQEDIVIAAIEAGLHASVPVYGGSAGDGLSFENTYICSNGTYHQNSALLVLIETDYHFQGIDFDHFTPTTEQMVVTAAQPENRKVLELNGAPAAQEYARILGLKVADLSPSVFAENPVLVRSGNKYHVRSIKGIDPDGGIVFLAAIDYGLVLTLGTGQELLSTLRNNLSTVTRRNRKPEFILGFDCVLRRLEIAEKGLVDAASDLLRQHSVFGFNTYGEQHAGVHVNQTFVGVALFAPVQQGAYDDQSR